MGQHGGQNGVPRGWRRTRWGLVGFLLVLSGRLAWAQERPDSTALTIPPIEPALTALPTGWVVASIGMLFLIVVLFVAYMFYLQRQFLRACREDNQLSLFLQTPAGVPAGTVRSIMTLIIVAFALYLLILNFVVPDIEFPQVLAAILSTVIGFYFGSRTASGGGGGSLAEELERTRRQKDEAVTTRDQSEATTLLGKVRKGVNLVKTVVDILPAEVQKKYGGTLDSLQRGAQVAESLLGAGNPGGAAAKASEVFTLFRQANPLRDIVTQALGSFGKVASVGIPPLAIVSALIGVSTTLIGTAYAKWKARVLHLPFSPAVLPLKLVDADTGFVLILQDPILKAAFAEQLAANDRPFMERVAREFLTQETAALWESYRPYFDSREDFEAGVEGFRRAAATLELEAEVDPALLQETGGLDPLLKAVDTLLQDDAARADLDLLMEVVEGLRKTNEPVKSIFDKVRQEVTS